MNYFLHVLFAVGIFAVLVVVFVALFGVWFYATLVRPEVHDAVETSAPDDRMRVCVACVQVFRAEPNRERSTPCTFCRSADSVPLRIK